MWIKPAPPSRRPTAIDPLFSPNSRERFGCSQFRRPLRAKAPASEGSRYQGRRDGRAPPIQRRKNWHRFFPEATGPPEGGRYTMQGARDPFENGTRRSNFPAKVGVAGISLL